MKVTVDFNEDEIEPALVKHFADGTGVQTYIKAALRCFNELRKAEQDGKAVGIGSSKDQMKRYNNLIDTDRYIRGELSGVDRGF